MSSRRKIRLSAICLGLALALVSSSAAFAADEPGGDGSPASSPPSFKFDAKYGDDDYASPPEEQASLQRIHDLAVSLGYLGSFRSDASTMNVRLPAGTALPEATRIGAFTVNFLGSVFTKNKLSTTRSSVRTLTVENASKGETWSSDYDARTDVVRVTGALSSEVQGLLGKLTGVAVVLSKGPMDTSRGTDPAPHWGGARMTNSSYSSYCSTGFEVQGGSGTYYMVSAGHCYSLNETVFSPHDDDLSGTANGTHITIGVVARRTLSGRDIELIGGSSYSPNIYMGGAQGSGYPVSSAKDPNEGDNLCFSGATSLENCGKTLESLQGDICTESGCFQHLARLSGGRHILGGDSGGPLVNKGANSVGARGIVKAIDNDTGDMYATRWASIVAEYPGMTIVLG